MSSIIRFVAVLAGLFLLAHCSADESAQAPAETLGDASAPPIPPGSSDAGTSDEGGRPPPPPPPPEKKKANIVFVLADDFSWNLVQYMPNVLAMQKNGMTFSNYIVSDSLCCPSRSSILTGRFPHDTGVFTNTGSDGGYATFKTKGNETKTFATTLIASGYRTALMGKYLNGYDPLVPTVPPGWTEWAVAGNGYDNFEYDLNENGAVVHHGSAEEDYLTDVIAARGAAFVTKDPGKPFLLELATFAPHSPYVNAPRDDTQLVGVQIARAGAYDAVPGPTAPAWLAAITPLPSGVKQVMDISYRKRARSVLAIDKMIGTLQAAVAAAGQAGNTYFVFSSDNGYHMGERSMRPGKLTAFDEDIRVPLIVTGPDVPAGKTRDEVVQNIDLCATFAEMGLTTPPPTNTGRSLLPLLRGDTVTGFRDVALVEHHGHDGDTSDPDAPAANSGNPPTYVALRTKRYLYVEYVTGESEYYDHATDPYELDNTAGSLTASQVAALHGTLVAIQGCHDAASCWTAQHVLPGAP